MIEKILKDLNKISSNNLSFIEAAQKAIETTPNNDRFYNVSAQVDMQDKLSKAIDLLNEYADQQHLYNRK
ncbi:hypothetical protein [Saccharibacillus deserti]|uniref:hypothetical protein n=1 Tax=Saccharibacillus deserti TaxID=1634444 RepID=UPI0015575942|nr:hypothetical protein [Saccharibacillus deserti]